MARNTGYTGTRTKCADCGRSMATSIIDCAGCGKSVCQSRGSGYRFVKGCIDSHRTFVGGQRVYHCGEAR